MKRIRGSSCVSCGASFFGKASETRSCPRCRQEIKLDVDPLQRSTEPFDFLFAGGGPLLQFEEAEEELPAVYDPLVFRVQGPDLDEGDSEEQETGETQRVGRESWRRVTRGMLHFLD